VLQPLRELHREPFRSGEKHQLAIVKLHHRVAQLEVQPLTRESAADIDTDGALPDDELSSNAAIAILRELGVDETTMWGILAQMAERLLPKTAIILPGLHCSMGGRVGPFGHPQSHRLLREIVGFAYAAKLNVVP
jgi:hypothetical protein